MRKINEKYVKGSALILTVVLTSLLAIVGVMFVMAANMDKLTSSSVSTNKELNFAVDSVVAEISHELILDVPGMPSARYYDYPDANDAWLANLEPDSTNHWRQISDVTGFIRHYWGSTAVQNVPISQSAVSLIGEHDRIAVDNTGHITGLTAQDGQYADADGDGVVDSKWIELETASGTPALTKSGKHIYAAIRVIDNCAMLNANTAYKFNSSPTADMNEINGKSLWQINFMALADRPGKSTHSPTDETDFFQARANNVAAPTLSDLSNYDKYVIWQYCSPLQGQKYTPFDITDELELRYRFLLNNENADTRLESWGGQFRNTATGSTPVTSLSDWYKSVYTDGTSGVIDPNYSYRHLATTYSFDRIMNPEGPFVSTAVADGNMVSINHDPNQYTPSLFAKQLYDAITEALKKTLNPMSLTAQQDANAAQLAANIAGYTTNVTAEAIGVTDSSSIIHYAFQPQPLISEIGIIITDPCDINKRHYAVELYNPFNVAIPLNDFSLNLTPLNTLPGTAIQLPADTIDPNGHYVIVNHSGIFTISGTAKQTVNGSLVLSHDYTGTPPNSCINENIILTRKASNGDTICLDRQNTVMTWFLAATPGEYFERDDVGANILYQHDSNTPGSLGKKNTPQNQNLGWKFNLLPFNQSKFVTVGDMSRVLTVGPGTDPTKTLGQQLESASNEGAVRVDLRNPDYRNLFQYLTVLDPAHDKLDNDGDGITDEGSLRAPEKTPEVKIPGRININTAPWYVIAQLPWVYDATHTPNYELAKAIVAYRDKQDLSSSGGPNYTSRQSGTGGINNIREAAGFESIGELATVISNSMNYSIDYYAYDSQSGLSTFPDLTPDTSLDDFEERDLIFSRISNLVTVRSDVFTAYILVRIGPDGPQKRVIAILDRSDVYPASSTGGAAGKVKIVALWPVPDAR